MSAEFVFDPEKHRVLPNGAIYDMEKKRIVSNPGGGTKGITQENASALARRRWDLARAEFVAGFQEAVPIDPRGIPTPAWQAVGRKSMELIVNAKSARGFADLARFAGEAGGFIPSARGRGDDQADEPTEQTVIIQIAQYITKLVQPEDELHEAIDGEISE